MHIQKLLHHAGLVAEIQEFIVNKDLRGFGIGTKMIDKIKEKATQSGCMLIEVCCSLGRYDSHNFYINRDLKRTHYKFCKLFNE